METGAKNKKRPAIWLKSRSTLTAFGHLKLDLDISPDECILILIAAYKENKSLKEKTV